MVPVNGFASWLLPTAMLLPSAAFAASVVIGDFSARGLDDWEMRSFSGETNYEVTQVDGRQVIRADSDASASGLYRRKTVDLAATPWLHWEWRVEDVLDDIDETTRSGDDYPARVYVVFSGGLAFWRTRTVVYVWASELPRGSQWHSAFTGNARMIAVQSGAGRAGEWISEARNVREDYRRLFNEDVEQADAVAIMTDTDNSGQSATAWYGDIRFSDSERPD